MSSTVNAVASSSKLPKTKKSKSDKHKRNGEAEHQKSRDGANGLQEGGKKKKKKKQKHVEPEGPSPFEHRRMNMRLSVPPKFSADYMYGVREQLDRMVMRYVPQVQGVLLAHWDHSFLDESANIINECPFGVVDVEFDTLIWAPKLGQKLYGTHSLSSPSHLSLLFSRTFNVSIPLQHIPQDVYEFQATNPDDIDSEEEESDSEDGILGLGGLNGHGQVEEVGRWVSRANGRLVGKTGKGIQFTVIGMHVTNQMLSLTGSLLSDPHNPPPAPEPPVIVTQVRVSPSPSPELEQPAAARPAKKARADKTTTAAQRSVDRPASAVAPVEDYKEEVDESFLTPRELKQKRKADEKAKREAKKAQRAEREMIAVQAVGGKAAVDMSGTTEEAEGGKKRKNGEGDGGKQKKRKE